MNPFLLLGYRRGLLERLLRLSAALFLIGITAACQPVGMGAPGPQTGQLIDPSQPVPVALLVPGNSGNADLDRLARSLVNSAKMARADAQGAQIDLRVYRTGGNTGTAVDQANKAIADGAQIILGPLFAEAANAVGKVAMAQNVNVLAFSNNPDIANGNVFILGNTFDNTADRLVSYGLRQGKRRFFVVAENDVSGQVGARAIEAAIARHKGILAGKATHPVSKAGINGVMPKIAANAKSGNTDVIFLTANHVAVLPYLTDRMAELGITSATTQMMGLTRWDQPVSRRKLKGVQGGWFAIPGSGRKAAFEQRYRAAYGETPHELGSLAYDGVSAVAALVRAGKRNALMTTGLTQSSGFVGITGPFRLLPDRTNQRALAIATIRNGQVIILDPAPRSFGRFGF